VLYQKFRGQKVQKLTRLTGPATKKPRSAFLQFIHDLYLCTYICPFLGGISFTLLIRKSLTQSTFWQLVFSSVLYRDCFFGLGALEPATFPKIDFLVVVFRACFHIYRLFILFNVLLRPSRARHTAMAFVSVLIPSARGLSSASCCLRRCT